MSNIYYEKQKGGLCRKHSLNAFFGKEKITEPEFNSLCQEFDQYLVNKGYVSQHKTKEFDQIHSSQESIVSYILKKNGKHCLFIAFNYVKQYLNERKINFQQLTKDSTDIFVFNQNHIWLCKKVDDLWYRIDSLSGVKRDNINMLPRQKNIGVIIVRNKEECQTDLQFYRNKLLEHFEDLSQIEHTIEEIYKKGDILGNIELEMTLCFEILEYLGKGNPNYQEFLKKYEKNRFNLQMIKEQVAKFVKHLSDV